MGKTLVVYYSFDGNTAFAAELFAQNGADCERLTVDREPPHKGIGKFLRGGMSALCGRDPGLHPLEHNPAQYDTIVIGFPVWAGRPAPAVTAFVKKYAFTGKTVYIFASSASGDSDKAIETLKSALPGNRFADCVGLTDPLKNPQKAKEALVSIVRQALG